MILALAANRNRRMRPRRRRPTRERAEPLTQLTTRVLRSLRQRVRVHCFRQDRDMQDFVAAALREALHRRQRGRHVGGD